MDCRDIYYILLTYSNNLYQSRNLYGKGAFSTPEDYSDYFKGGFFYTNPSAQTLENTIYFPSYGYREYRTGSIVYFGHGSISVAMSVRAYSANRTWTEGIVVNGNRMVGSVEGVLFWDPYYVASDDYCMGYNVYMTKN